MKDTEISAILSITLIKVIFDMLDNELNFDETSQLSFMSTFVYAMCKKLKVNPVTTCVELTGIIMDLDMREGDKDD